VDAVLAEVTAARSMATIVSIFSKKTLHKSLDEYNETNSCPDTRLPIRENKQNRQKKIGNCFIHKILTMQLYEI
jgi:hypothetical protein